MPVDDVCPELLQHMWDYVVEAPAPPQIDDTDISAVQNLRGFVEAVVEPLHTPESFRRARPLLDRFVEAFFSPQWSNASRSPSSGREGISSNNNNNNKKDVEIEPHAASLSQQSSSTVTQPSADATSAIRPSSRMEKAVDAHEDASAAPQASSGLHATGPAPAAEPTHAAAAAAATTAAAPVAPAAATCRKQHGERRGLTPQPHDPKAPAISNSSSSSSSSSGGRGGSRQTNRSHRQSPPPPQWRPVQQRQHQQQKQQRQQQQQQRQQRQQQSSQRHNPQQQQQQQKEQQQKQQQQHCNRAIVPSASDSLEDLDWPEAPPPRRRLPRKQQQVLQQFGIAVLSAASSSSSSSSSDGVHRGSKGSSHRSSRSERAETAAAAAAAAAEGGANCLCLGGEHGVYGICLSCGLIRCRFGISTYEGAPDGGPRCLFCGNDILPSAGLTALASSVERRLSDNRQQLALLQQQQQQRQQQQQQQQQQQEEVEVEGPCGKIKTLRMQIAEDEAHLKGQTFPASHPAILRSYQQMDTRGPP